MERMGNLQELYRSEELNQRALDQYLTIHYLPGIANQTINFVNIYRAQALLIIDAVNEFLNPGKKTLTVEEWKSLYERDDILPGLEDREGNQRTVAQWVKAFHDAAFLAHEKRAEYQRVKKEYHSPLSREYYAYLFTLSVAQTHFNGYSREEKREILRRASYNETLVDGVLLRDGLEVAIKIPGLDGDRKAIYLRYQGSLCARQGALAETEEERFAYRSRARELFEESIRLAEQIGNQNAKRLAEAELRRLES
jgi:HSP20 family molecular chaperone IbpA